MVSFVIVSHVKKLAEGVAELAKMMAPNVQISTAGGLEDGSNGTSFEIISEAINSVRSEDGTIILVDMGSAVMTAEMVIDGIDDNKPIIADCPIVEGAVLGAVLAESGAGIDEIIDELKTVHEQKKLE